MGDTLPHLLMTRNCSHILQFFIVGVMLFMQIMHSRVEIINKSVFN